MEISGKIIAVLPIIKGNGKNDTEWKKQDYVVETHDQYPKKMCFNLWGDKIDQFSVKLGDEVTVSFDIDAKEWNGKWFNSVNAWKVEVSNFSNANTVKVDNSKSTNNSQDVDPLPF